MQSLLCTNRPSINGNSSSTSNIATRFGGQRIIKRYATGLHVRDKSRLLKYRDEGQNPRIHPVNLDTSKPPQSLDEMNDTFHEIMGTTKEFETRRTFFYAQRKYFETLLSELMSNNKSREMLLSELKALIEKYPSFNFKEPFDLLQIGVKHDLLNNLWQKYYQGENDDLIPDDKDIKFGFQTSVTTENAIQRVVYIFELALNSTTSIKPFTRVEYVHENFDLDDQISDYSEKLRLDTSNTFLLPYRPKENKIPSARFFPDYINLNTGEKYNYQYINDSGSNLIMSDTDEILVATRQKSKYEIELEKARQEFEGDLKNLYLEASAQKKIADTQLPQFKERPHYAEDGLPVAPNYENDATEKFDSPGYKYPARFELLTEKRDTFVNTEEEDENADEIPPISIDHNVGELFTDTTDVQLSDNALPDFIPKDGEIQQVFETISSFEAAKDELDLELKNLSQRLLEIYVTYNSDQLGFSDKNNEVGYNKGFEKGFKDFLLSESLKEKEAQTMDLMSQLNPREVFTQARAKLYRDMLNTPTGIIASLLPLKELEDNDYLEQIKNFSREEMKEWIRQYSESLRDRAEFLSWDAYMRDGPIDLTQEVKDLRQEELELEMFIQDNPDAYEPVDRFDENGNIIDFDGNYEEYAKAFENENPTTIYDYYDVNVKKAYPLNRGYINQSDPFIEDKEFYEYDNLEDDKLAEVITKQIDEFDVEEEEEDNDGDIEVTRPRVSYEEKIPEEIPGLKLIKELTAYDISLLGVDREILNVYYGPDEVDINFIETFNAKLHRLQPFMHGSNDGDFAQFERRELENKLYNAYYGVSKAELVRLDEQKAVDNFIEAKYNEERELYDEAIETLNGEEGKILEEVFEHEDEENEYDDENVDLYEEGMDAEDLKENDLEKELDAQENLKDLEGLDFKPTPEEEELEELVELDNYYNEAEIATDLDADYNPFSEKSKLRLNFNKASSNLDEETLYDEEEFDGNEFGTSSYNNANENEEFRTVESIIADEQAGAPTISQLAYFGPQLQSIWEDEAHLRNLNEDEEFTALGGFEDAYDYDQFDSEQKLLFAHDYGHQAITDRRTLLDLRRSKALYSFINNMDSVFSQENNLNTTDNYDDVLDLIESEELAKQKYEHPLEAYTHLPANLEDVAEELRARKAEKVHRAIVNMGDEELEEFEDEEDDDQTSSAILCADFLNSIKVPGDEEDYIETIPEEDLEDTAQEVEEEEAGFDNEDDDFDGVMEDEGDGFEGGNRFEQTEEDGFVEDEEYNEQEDEADEYNENQQYDANMEEEVEEEEGIDENFENREVEEVDENELGEGNLVGDEDEMNDDDILDEEEDIEEVKDVFMAPDDLTTRMNAAADEVFQRYNQPELNFLKTSDAERVEDKMLDGMLEEELEEMQEEGFVADATDFPFNPEQMVGFCETRAYGRTIAKEYKRLRDGLMNLEFLQKSQKRITSESTPDDDFNTRFESIRKEASVQDTSQQQIQRFGQFINSIQEDSIQNFMFSRLNFRLDQLGFDFFPEKEVIERTSYEVSQNEIEDDLLDDRSDKLVTLLKQQHARIITKEEVEKLKLLDDETEYDDDDDLATYDPEENAFNHYEEDLNQEIYRYIDLVNNDNLFSEREIAEIALELTKTQVEHEASMFLGSSTDRHYSDQFDPHELDSDHLFDEALFKDGVVYYENNFQEDEMSITQHYSPLSTIEEPGVNAPEGKPYLFFDADEQSYFFETPTDRELALMEREKIEDRMLRMVSFRDKNAIFSTFSPISNPIDLLDISYDISELHKLRFAEATIDTNTYSEADLLQNVHEKYRNELESTKYEDRYTRVNPVLDEVLNQPSEGTVHKLSDDFYARQDVKNVDDSNDSLMPEIAFLESYIKGFLEGELLGYFSAKENATPKSSQDDKTRNDQIPSGNNPLVSLNMCKLGLTPEEYRSTSPGAIFFNQWKQRVANSTVFLTDEDKDEIRRKTQVTKFIIGNDKSNSLYETLEEARLNPIRNIKPPAEPFSQRMATHIALSAQVNLSDEIFLHKYSQIRGEKEQPKPIISDKVDLYSNQLYDVTEFNKLPAKERETWEAIHSICKMFNFLPKDVTFSSPRFYKDFASQLTSILRVIDPHNSEEVTASNIFQSLKKIKQAEFALFKEQAGKIFKSETDQLRENEILAEIRDSTDIIRSNTLEKDIQNNLPQEDNVSRDMTDTAYYKFFVELRDRYSESLALQVANESNLYEQIALTSIGVNSSLPPKLENDYTTAPYDHQEYTSYRDPNTTYASYEDALNDFIDMAFNHQYGQHTYGWIVNPNQVPKNMEDPELVRFLEDYETPAQAEKEKLEIEAKEKEQLENEITKRETAASLSQYLGVRISSYSLDTVLHQVKILNHIKHTAGKSKEEKTHLIVGLASPKVSPDIKRQLWKKFYASSKVAPFDAVLYYTENLMKPHDVDLHPLKWPGMLEKALPFFNELQDTDADVNINPAYQFNEQERIAFADESLKTKEEEEEEKASYVQFGGLANSKKSVDDQTKEIEQFIEEGELKAEDFEEEDRVNVETAQQHLDKLTAKFKDYDLVGNGHRPSYFGDFDRSSKMEFTESLQSLVSDADDQYYLPSLSERSEMFLEETSVFENLPEEVERAKQMRKYLKSLLEYGKPRVIYAHATDEVAHPAGTIRVEMTHKKGNVNYGHTERRHLTINLYYRTMILFVDGQPTFSFAIPPAWTRAFKKHYWPSLYPKMTGPDTDFYNYSDVSPIRTNKNFIQSQYERTTFRWGHQRKRY